MNAWFLLHKEQTKCHRNHLAKINIPSRSMISSCSPIVITGTDSAQVPRWPLHMCTSLESHSHVNGVIAFPRLGRRILWTPDMEIVNAVVTACGRDTWMNICLMHCARTVRGHSTDGCIGRLISDAWWSLLTDSKKEHLCFSFFPLVNLDQTLELTFDFLNAELLGLVVSCWFLLPTLSLSLFPHQANSENERNVFSDIGNSYISRSGVLVAPVPVWN